MSNDTNISERHVIFGTGPIGKWTAVALLKLGKQVTLINRSGHAKGLPDGVTVIKGDAYDGAWVTETTRGATAIYQCAQPAYHEWVEKFPPLQTAILNAATANKARLIAVENLYSYGDTHGQPMREDTPQQAHTRKGQVRRALSEALFAAHRAGQVEVAAVRGSDFFGPDYLLTRDMIVGPALQRKPINVIGSLDHAHTFTYTVDFGRTMAQVGCTPAALGQVWHVPSASAITQRALADALAAELGFPVKTRVATPLLMRLLGLFNPSMREMNEMMYEFTQPFIMDSGKAQRELNLAPTPLTQQIRETVAWAKAFA